MLKSSLLSGEIVCIFRGFFLEDTLTEVAKDITEVCRVKRKKEYEKERQSSPIHVVYILDWTNLSIFSDRFRCFLLFTRGKDIKLIGIIQN